MDINGLPHAIHVTTANISDKAGALGMLENNRSALSCVVNVLCDGGYAGKAFAKAVQETIGANVQIVRRSELHQFAVLPKRWIVERSFGQLDKCRRLWKNFEHYLHTSCQMVVLAFIALLCKRF
ncbi:MAG: transposase [Oscillospiraceae bacterium]|nr:transposase [Oscillospiraceae bacterium]